MSESSLDSLNDEQIMLLMEAAQVGVRYGLDVAEKRLRGELEYELLSWHLVREALDRGD